MEHRRHKKKSTLKNWWKETAPVAIDQVFHYTEPEERIPGKLRRIESLFSVVLFSFLYWFRSHRNDCFRSYNHVPRKQTNAGGSSRVLPPSTVKHHHQPHFMVVDTQSQSLSQQRQSHFNTETYTLLNDKKSLPLSISNYLFIVLIHKYCFWVTLFMSFLLFSEFLLFQPHVLFHPSWEQVISLPNTLCELTTGWTHIPALLLSINQSTPVIIYLSQSSFFVKLFIHRSISYLLVFFNQFLSAQLFGFVCWPISFSAEYQTSCCVWCLWVPLPEPEITALIILSEQKIQQRDCLLCFNVLYLHYYTVSTGPFIWVLSIPFYVFPCINETTLKVRMKFTC